MTKRTLTGLAAIAAVTLTACGGGGGSGVDREASVGGSVGSGSSGRIDPNITVTEAQRRFRELNVGFTNIDEFNSSQRDLPTSGDTTYTGQFGFDVRGAVPGGGSSVDGSFVGDMVMDIEFGGDRDEGGDIDIEGTVSNILYADTAGNIDITAGTLDIDGGIVDTAAGNGFISADATGNITLNQDGTDKTVAFNLDMSGQFGGQDGADSGDVPETVRGFVVGSGSGDGLSLEAPNGRFAGQRPGVNVLDR